MCQMTDVNNTELKYYFSILTHSPWAAAVEMVAAKMHSVAHRPANDCIPTVQFNNTQNTVSKKTAYWCETVTTGRINYYYLYSAQIKQAPVRGAGLANWLVEKRKEKFWDCV